MHCGDHYGRCQIKNCSSCNEECASRKMDSTGACDFCGPIELEATQRDVTFEQVLLEKLSNNPGLMFYFCEPSQVEENEMRPCIEHNCVPTAKEKVMVTQNTESLRFCDSWRTAKERQRPLLC